MVILLVYGVTDGVGGNPLALEFKLNADLGSGSEIHLQLY